MRSSRFMDLFVLDSPPLIVGMLVARCMMSSPAPTKLLSITPHPRSCCTAATQPHLLNERMSDAAAVFRDTKSFCTVNGYEMAYVEMQNDDASEVGDTLVFLHGNPTSSYLWRDVMAPLQGDARRLIAPDLIGMGDSDKLEDSSDAAYSFVEHVDYIEKFMKDCVKVGEDDKVILVIHDWGSALGFHWALKHPDQVKGIVYMEALVKPSNYAEFTPDFAQFFQSVRTPDVGEQMILEDNMFVEQILPSAILRNLTADEMSVYAAPYSTPGESRRTTLAWPREVPIDGTPVVNAEMVDAYSKWMGENDIPKLLISATPGLLLINDSLDLARTWKNQQEVTVDGLHFIQEDSPAEIASAIDEWLESDVFAQSSTKKNAASDDASAYLWVLAAAFLFRKFW